MTNSGSAITLSPPYSFRSQAGIASSDLLSSVQESFIELVSITTCDRVDEAVVPKPLIQVFNITPTEPGKETPIVSLGSGAITPAYVPLSLPLTESTSSILPLSSSAPTSSPPLVPSSTTSPLPAARPAPTSTSNALNINAKIGIGVAIPVFVFALLIVAVTLLWRGIWRRNAAKSKKEGKTREDHQPYFQHKAELEAVERIKHELETRERKFELDGDDTVHEISWGTVEHGLLCFQARQELRGPEHSQELEVLG